jgi:PAS domain-containing protein
MAPAVSDLFCSCETITDSLSDGVYMCDRDRRIVYWNRLKM